MWEMLGENLVIWLTIRMNLLSSVIKDGGFIAKKAAVFFGSGEILL